MTSCLFSRRRIVGLQLKRAAAVSEDDVISVACGYCGAYEPAAEIDCRRDAGDARRVCVTAMHVAVANYVREKGWQTSEH